MLMSVFTEAGEILDRSRIRDEAMKFGSTRFTDEENAYATQNERLQRLYSEGKNQVLDGIRHAPMSLHTVLQARAALSTGTAGGVDGTTPEVYRELPFIVCLLYWSSFQFRSDAFEHECPAAWKLMEYVGIPKPDSKGPFTFDKSLRWIAKVAVSQKWYQYAVRQQLRQQVRPIGVETYGFKPGRRTTDITGVIRQVFHTAWTFQSSSVYLAALDIKTAFDDMRHGILERAMRQRGIHPLTIHNVLRELSELQARINIQGCEVTDPFPFTKGGKQGGNDTPDLFNLVVEYLLRDTTQAWSRRGWGCSLLQGSPVSHLIWCDNIWLLADSRETLEAMIAETTAAIYAGGFSWKESSLQVMGGGDAVTDTLGNVVCRGREGIMTFTAVDRMLVLGEMIDNHGSTATSIDYRLGNAESNFWANSQAFRAPGMVKDKLDAWRRGPRASASQGACTWHLTRDLLHKIWTWELRWLRRALRLRRKPDEDYVEYMRRTAARIKQNIANHHHKPFHVAVLESYFAEAFREQGAGTDDSTIVRRARSYNARDVWMLARGATCKRRRVERLVQRSGGLRAAWEDPLVEYLGVDWRGQRDKHTRVDWERRGKAFVAHVCARWQLPVCDLRESENEFPRQPLAKRSRTGHGQAKECLKFRSLEPEVDELQDTLASKICWASPCRHFLYATDSESLQLMVCGRAILHDRTYDPLISRVLDRIISHMGKGWRPPQLHEDPVQWWRRCHNRVADGLADLTMDKRKTWETRYETSALTLDRSNVIIQTDGGLREGDCAAAAWIIGFWGQTLEGWTFEPLVVHGTYIELPCTVFRAEAIALDEASREFAALLAL